MKKILILSLISYFVSLWFAPATFAATGANQMLTFQGKMVNADGTNVTDGLYDFVFNIYDSAASTGTSQFAESWTNAALYTSTMTSAPAANGESLTYSSNTNEASLLVGQILWNTTLGEAVTITSVNAGTNVLGISPTRQAWNNTDTITNRIYVKDGIFRVALNSLSQSATFSTIFTDDTRFLGINFNSDGEMRPRVRLTAAPYAMNAASLGSVDAGGYLRSNTSDNYTSGTLTTDSGTTLDINGDISIADTNIALDGASTTFTTTGAFTLTPGGAVTLGDGGDTLAINTSDWDISTTGTLTNTEWQGTAISTTYGGTGQNWGSVAQGSLPYFNGTGTMTTLAGAGTNGWVLKYNTGTSVPYWAADTDTNTTYTAGNDIDFNGTQIDLEPILNYVTGITLASGDLTLTTVSGNLVNISTGNLKVGNGTPGVTLNGEDAYIEGTLEVDGAVQLDGALDTNGDVSIADTDIALDGASTNLAATGNFSLNTDDIVASKASGNIGIGTTNPDTRFVVNDNQAANTVLKISNSSISQPNRGAALELAPNISQAYSRISQNISDSFQMLFENLANSNDVGFIFKTNVGGSQERMRITGSGNVGIGTTNPGYKLQVAGDIDVTTGNTYRLAGADVGQFFIDAAGTNGQVWTSDGTGRGGWTTISAGTTYTASNGLTLSTADFQLGGDLTRDTTITQDSAENLTFTNSGTGNTVFNLSSTGDFMVQDNGTAALFVKDDGNVGIGTTNPTALLDVAGTASVSALTVRGASPAYYNTLNGNDIRFRTSVGGDDGLTDRLAITNSGSVGIGTTNPGAKLEVTGDILLSAGANRTISIPSNWLTAGNSLTLQAGSGTDAGGHLYLKAGSSAANPNHVYIDSHPGDGNPSFVLLQSQIAAGNVGIGTTNPGYKLQVAGDIDVTTGNTYRLAGADVGQYFIDAAGTNGQVWTSDGTGRGGWTTISAGTTYTAGNDIDFAGTQIDLEPQLDFVTTISRASSNLTLQTTTSGNIYLTSAGSVNVTGDLILTGKASSASTTEGSLYYDTDDDQLKVYANGKWQADRSATTLIVAASDSKNKEKADYVADGTNDQTEINAAITALPSTGGAVVLLDGTYNIGNGSAGRINIAKSNVSLIGSGASTVIKRMFNESGNNGLIVIGNGSGTYTKITVSNLSVDGNNGTYTNSYNHGIYATGTTTYVNLTNNWINNAGGYGVYFSSSDANRYNVTGNYLAANTEGGIYAVTYYLNIANNQFVQNGSWGTSGYDIYSPDTGSSITNNVFYLPQYRGIRLSTNGVTVGNNTFRGCANYCIFLDSATSNIVTANTFYQDGSHTAIAVNASHRNTIADNNINELGNTRNGILLTGSSTNNTLTGNQVYSTNTSAGAAIQIDSGSTGNYLADNRFSGSGTATQGTNVLTDSATGTIYGGQTTNGNSNFAFTPTGNVGIGTTEPTSLLTINNSGVLRVSGTSTSPTWPSSGSGIDISYDADGSFSAASGGGGAATIVPYDRTGSAYKDLRIRGLNTAFDANGTTAILINSSGDIGIGTTAPSGKFEVNGAGARGYIADTNSLSTSSGGQIWAMSEQIPTAAGQRLGVAAFGAYTTGTTTAASGMIGAYADGAWSSTSAPTYLTLETIPSGSTTRAERVRITNAGSVGIGTTSPSVALHVVGNGRFTAIGSGTYAGAVNRTSDGTFTTATSDLRFKKDVQTIDNALDKVTRLRGVTFNWIDPNEPKRMTGMIAQEVLDVMPELVFQNPTDGYYGLLYGETSGLLIEAIKELNLKVDTLGNLPQLTQQIDQLDSQFSLLSVDVATHTNWLTELKDQLTSLFNRQDQIEERSQQLEARIEQVATLSASPSTKDQGLNTDVSTLSARISYLEQQVATGLAPEPVSVASVAGIIQDVSLLKGDLESYAQKVDLALELTASQSALIATLLQPSESPESPVSSASSVLTDLNLSSLTVGDIDANLLTVGVINSATNHLAFMGDLMTLDATGSLVTINGDLTVTGSISALDISTQTASIAGILSAPIIDQLASRSASLEELVASMSAELATLKDQLASQSATASQSAVATTSADALQ